MRLFSGASYGSLGWWFRFGYAGPGLSCVPRTEPKLFSERNGYIRNITIWRWRLRFLRKLTP